jgi:hypothetical protein
MLGLGRPFSVVAGLEAPWGRWLGMLASETQRRERFAIAGATRSPTGESVRDTYSRGMTARGPSIYALALMTMVLAGCPGDDGSKDPCADGGADEVSANECAPDDGAGPLGPDECLTQSDPDREGYRVQCEGEVHSRIDFNVLGMNCEEAIDDEEFCSQFFPFGPPFDTYEAPDVMACCGENWDPVENLDVYQHSCMADLAEQACASMAIRLEKAIENGDFKTELGDFSKKAKNLHAYIVGHHQDCMAALYEGDTDPDHGQLVSQWALPNKVYKGWWPAKDIVVYVEAGTSVVDVHRPEDQADWLECHGPTDNDDEIFEDQTSPEGEIVIDVALAAGVDGELVGPVVGGNAVTSSMTFDTNCVDQGCPDASWSYRRGTDPSFTMEDLRLYATNFVVTSNTRVLAVDRGRVELWKQAHGTKIVAPDGGVLGYEVPAGQAWFYVAGMADGVYGRFMAVNSTDIELTVVDEMWTIGSFDVEILDAADRTWTITLADSRWQP